MAYTNPWSNNTPLGSADASTIDDAIRQLRLDLNERLLTILSSSFDTDPWVLDVSGIGARTGVTRTFSHHLCVGHQDEDSLYWNDEYFMSDDNQNFQVYMPILLPVGATLTDFDVVVDIHNSSQVAVDLRYQQFQASPTSQQVATSNLTSTGVIIHPILDGGSHTVTSGAYYVKFNNAVGSGEYRIYGARATYNVSGLSEYL